MNEPLASAGFTPAGLTKYIQLYASAVAANNDNVEFVVGPQLDPNNWDTFVTGIEKCLNTIHDNVGVPLSYML